MPQLGETRRLHAEFEAAGVDTDPTTVTLTITSPSGLIQIPLATHDGNGVYHYDLLLNEVGVWTAEWEGTGTVPVNGTQYLTVTGAALEGPQQAWIIWGELGDYCTPPDISTALQDAVLQMATRTVWNRSCKQFGLTTIDRARVTPVCRHAYITGYEVALPSSWYSWSGAWPGYYPMASCACGSYPFIDLGVAPVHSVDEVWIDGAPFTNFRVDDWRRLVRTDGQSWPTSALGPAPGGTPTVEVSWTYGLDVPDDGKMAVALLACKYAREADGDCAVSTNATTIAREGVVIQLNPPKGDTGIALVEQWLSQFHCGGGSLYDPGARRSTMRVGT